MIGRWPFFRQNHLSSAGIISLASGLRSNRSVKTLNLMTQKLGAIGYEKVSSVIDLVGSEVMFRSSCFSGRMVW